MIVYSYLRIGHFSSRQIYNHEYLPDLLVLLCWSVACSYNYFEFSALLLMLKWVCLSAVVCNYSVCLIAVHSFWGGCWLSLLSVWAQILMFPILLDDQSLFTEFETFIEAIDNKHELALEGQQQFPVSFVLCICIFSRVASSFFLICLGLWTEPISFQGVYALFFFKRRVRSVGHRLAGSMGKLRYCFLIRMVA